MVDMIAGFTFGVLIGYLSWYTFRPGETQESIPIEKLGAFIGIIGGAAIVNLFPTGTEMFASYAVGLAVGFFFTPIKKYIDTTESKTKKQKEASLQKEKDEIHKNWANIEKVIHHKLEKNSYAEGVRWKHLHELPYSKEGMIYLMRHYAQLHIDEGVEFKIQLSLDDYYPELTKRRY